MILPLPVALTFLVLHFPFLTIPSLHSSCFIISIALPTILSYPVYFLVYSLAIPSTQTYEYKDLVVFLVPRIVPQCTFMAWMKCGLLGLIPRDFDLVGVEWSLGICVLTNIPGVSDVSGSLSGMTFRRTSHSLSVSSTLMVSLGVCYYKLTICESVCPVLISRLSSSPFIRWSLEHLRLTVTQHLRLNITRAKIIFPWKSVLSQFFFLWIMPPSCKARDQDVILESLLFNIQ